MTMQNRPWLDADLPVEDRVELLLSAMTPEEKAGQWFHAAVHMRGLDERAPGFANPTAREYIVDRHMNCFGVVGPANDARVMARWYNELQELALSTRLGIPITLSTDPRHSFTDNPGASASAGAFSQWPEAMGLAALRDESLIERYGDIVRQEYLAVGLRAALHPQVDLATEPRWARQAAGFSEDAELSGALAAAYIRGMQGEKFGAASISTTTKHFPGGGAQKNGEDPHFSRGKEQIYPGGQFELHLKPFEMAIAAGTRQIMPYYGMPVGTEYEEVGFCFNRDILTGLLRERLGFEGVIAADWSILTDATIMGATIPARAWGDVENMTPREKMKKAIDAGVDQFGGEHCTEVLLDLLATGDVSEERVDASVRRLLREKFLLGLFENPHVDVDAAATTVGREDFVAAGKAAQRAALTVLKNDGVLPHQGVRRIYVEGIDPEIAGHYAEVVSDPESADLAILRLKAPFEQRESWFETKFHSGSLDFPSEVVAHVTEIAAQVPVVLDVYLDRPAILTPFVDVASAMMGNWGASADALLDVIFGNAQARGQLPFDLPRSMQAVENSHPDAPFDTADPLFRFGHGLTVG